MPPVAMAADAEASTRCGRIPAHASSQRLARDQPQRSYILARDDPTFAATGRPRTKRCPLHATRGGIGAVCDDRHGQEARDSFLRVLAA